MAALGRLQHYDSGLLDAAADALLQPVSAAAAAAQGQQQGRLRLAQLAPREVGSTACGPAFRFPCNIEVRCVPKRY